MSRRFPFARPRLQRLAAATGLAAAALLGTALPAADALAAAPQQKTQVPGFYRHALGAFEVTALYDGYLDLDAKLLKNASAAEVQRLLAKQFIAGEKFQIPVNAYVVNTGDKLVLIDTGTANAFGPSLGHVAANLRAAGYAPEQIDVVLLTHQHPDHTNGLIGADGKPAFPNAVVRVAQAESDFWLSPATLEKAPKMMQPFVKMAQAAAQPYVEAGRWSPFAGDTELLPGVRAVAANGHTPGHTAFEISSGENRLLIVGDAVHSHAVQFANPGVAVDFDLDQKAAVASRRKLFAWAAGNGAAIAGMHLPFPGIGHVRAEGKGFAWVPVEFSPIRTDKPAK